MISIWDNYLKAQFGLFNTNPTCHYSVMNWNPSKKLICLNEDRAQLFYDDFWHKVDELDLEATNSLLNSNGEFRDFLRALFSLSPYLRDRILFEPAILEELISTGLDEYCALILDQTIAAGKDHGSEAELMTALRKYKTRMAVTIAMADLAGWWDCRKVTRKLTEFADASLSATIEHILISAHNRNQFQLDELADPMKQCGLIVLAMGKHGAFELNYSSDIDLILFFDEQAGERVTGTDPTTFFTRFARQLVKILQERTPDGYVFRVDLRLRPDPGSTPPIMPLEAGLIYYESYGQNWERAAMIKARPATGDVEAGRALLQELTPFIWRKYLDFAAIQDVHSIKRQIHAHKGHASIATRGHNIKLGRGGIREIEFFAQTQQLIAGGRIAQLRTLRTIETIEKLHELEWIDRQAVDDLTKAYWYLRNVEHRLQMVRDEQTHTLPDDEQEFTRIAHMMAYSSGEDFTDDLTAMLQLVEQHYSSLFEMAPDLTDDAGNLVFAGDEEDPHTIETLSKMGYRRPSDIMRTIKGWHYGRYPALRTAQARELLTELTPMLLQEIAQTGLADETLIALDQFISGLPAGIQLFSLLKSNPSLLRLLTLLLSAAPRLAQIITCKPHVFDGLLDPAFNDVLPDRDLLEERLQLSLAKESEYELLLNRARIFAAEQKFLIGVRLLSGTINAAQAGRAFSELAVVMLEAMLKLVEQEFAEKHGFIDGGEISILAMGRLGSGELTAGSDLDLILLFDHDPDAEYSDGPKPMAVSQYFTRLTQRFIAAMSAPTSEGVIYELDFRLRPSGRSGPLATHFNSFIRYQQEQAWTWEHQALTRARPVAGSSQLSERVAEAMAEIIGGDYVKPDFANQIADMRYRMEKEKGSDNPFDCKNVAGGLIDLEFIAQWAILSVRSLPPTDSRQTRSVLQSVRGDLLDEDDCDELINAFDLYNSVLQLLQACLNEKYDPQNAPKGLQDILCQATGSPDIHELEQQLRGKQNTVREIFKRLIG